MSTLIVYGTKHGTAESCAKELCKMLLEKAELQNLKLNSNIDISKYDKVIIGGSIYAGRIQKEVSAFCTKNIDLLKEKKLGFFICCMNENEGEKQINTVFPKELLQNAIVTDSFGGAFEFNKMNFFERFIVKKISKVDKDKNAILMDNIKKFATAMNAV